jgi:hypothetical protein
VARPLHRASLKAATLVSVSIAALYYYIASVCAFLVFGPDIQDDVLINLR